jgi:hypothetical protein
MVATVERELFTGARRSTETEKLPRIRTEAFDEPPLPLGIERVHRQARLARSGHAAQTNELSCGEVDRDGPEVMSTRSDEVDVVHR